MTTFDRHRGVTEAPLLPLSDEMRDDARRYLARCDALDLAPMLGIEVQS